VVVEQSRRRRTDPRFRERWSRRTDLVRAALRTLVTRERTAARVAPTIPDEVAARFISVVGDGLLLQRAILGEVPHAEEVIALATAALQGGWVRRACRVCRVRQGRRAGGAGGAGGSAGSRA
jgi:hypothetical protein